MGNDLEQWLALNGEEEFRIAAITMADLWQGVERAKGAHRVRWQRFLERIFALFEPVAYTATTALHHARLWAELEASGKSIGAHDVILAAIAIERGDAVATFNIRQFGSVKGLKVVTP